MEIYEGNMNYYSNATGGTEEYGMGLRKGQSIKFNPYLGLAEKGKKETLAPFIALFHEFAHASNAVDDLKLQLHGLFYGNRLQGISYHGYLLLMISIYAPRIRAGLWISILSRLSCFRPASFNMGRKVSNR